MPNEIADTQTAEGVPQPGQLPYGTKAARTAKLAEVNDQFRGFDDSVDDADYGEDDEPDTPGAVGPKPSGGTE